MARGLNKVMLIGNLGKDPEVRYTPSGQAVATFSVATSRRRRDPNGGDYIEETEWHRVVAWERLAELASQYLQKGRQVYVEGRLQTRQWTDQQGQQRYTTEIIANDITLLGSRGDAPAHDDDWGEGANAPQQRPQRPQPQRKAPTDEETFASEDFEDVPF